MVLARLRSVCLWGLGGARVDVDRSRAGVGVGAGRWAEGTRLAEARGSTGAVVAVIGPEEVFFGGGGGERWASGQKGRRDRERGTHRICKVSEESIATDVA